MHSIGSAFVVGGHFFLALIRIMAVHQHMKRWIVFILLSALIASVLFYAFLWIVKLPYHALFQKPAFAAIIYVELHGSSISRFQGEHKVTLSLQSQPLH